MVAEVAGSGVQARHIAVIAQYSYVASATFQAMVQREIKIQMETINQWCQQAAPTRMPCTQLQLQLGCFPSNTKNNQWQWQWQ